MRWCGRSVSVVRNPSPTTAKAVGDVEVERRVAGVGPHQSRPERRAWSSPAAIIAAPRPGPRCSALTAMPRSWTPARRDGRGTVGRPGRGGDHRCRARRGRRGGGLGSLSCGKCDVVARRAAAQHLHAQLVDLLDGDFHHCVPRPRRPLMAAPRLAPRRSHRWLGVHDGLPTSSATVTTRSAIACGLVVVVGDEQRRRPLGAQDRGEVVDEPVVELAVEAGQRLVEEQHASATVPASGPAQPAWPRRR